MIRVKDEDEALDAEDAEAVRVSHRELRLGSFLLKKMEAPNEDRNEKIAIVLRVHDDTGGIEVFTEDEEALAVTRENLGLHQVGRAGDTAETTAAVCDEMK